MQNNAKGAGIILSRKLAKYSAFTRILFYNEGGNHCSWRTVRTVPRKMKSTKVQTLGAKRARCSVDVSHVNGLVHESSTESVSRPNAG